ncbi:hypothetical protein VHEMI02810 [[Torrubiella] hemipterigena]|uniref:Carbonyl reductase n=1 Tax=[Torrubiella] hemipterigena TaxID=1531966 RepID=A0A0A1T909_9HYPO|nr:hypothetical protein VHEMI02810 [[Torrubiella] hemipterigena]
MSWSCEKTIALITGANQGIGYAVAQHLVEKGTFTVLLGSRDAERGAKAAVDLDPSSEIVQAITIDVTDDASIQAAADHVAAKYGRLDVLVNNAGINNELEAYMLHLQTGATTDLEPLSLAKLRKAYHEVYEVNLFGAAAVTEAFSPLLDTAISPARIVFVSSHTGSLTLRSDSASPWHERMSRASFPIYRSSKAALNMLTLHYAAKFDSRGWKVNASCPNLTATSFTKDSGLGRPPYESAVNIVRLACLGEDGETGTCSDEKEIIGW